MLRPALRALQRPCISNTRCLRQPQTALTPLRQLPRNNRATNKQIIQRYVSNQKASTGSTWNAAKTLFRAYPYSVSLAAAMEVSLTNRQFFNANNSYSIVVSGGILMYSNYIYHHYIIGAFHTFPEPVAKELRKALFYTNQDLRPHDALKYYKKALRISEEIGMDPFSDEILGVKIQMAAFFEKIDEYEKSIQVLEIVKRDCLAWIDELGNKPENISSGKRTKVLAKTVQISTKLGELYSSPYVMRRDEAEKNLVWAVETALKELIRRQMEGVKEGEGAWMDRDAIGATMEALGNNYEEKDMHDLAAPLFLQAINLSPPNSCHTAVLMNNLSISLAQQSPTPEPGQPAASRTVLVENARTWAKKAIEIGSAIAPPARNEECDVACAVATHNLAEFAEMLGDYKEARLKYADAESVAKTLGFTEGVKNAQAGLKRLEGK